MQREMNVFAAFPHMHQLGASLELSTLREGGTSEMRYRIDPWRFGDQPMDPVDFIVKPGERLQTRCTWDNTTERRVTFGESSFDEMCFMVLFNYPSSGSELCF